jgi:short-subunit dehydrogenase
MNGLAKELRERCGIKVSVHIQDLSDPAGPAKLVRLLEDQGLVPDLLVNNAGFGLSQRFIDHDPDRLAEMLQLNIVSATELSRILGRRMAQRG